MCTRRRYLSQDTRLKVLVLCDSKPGTGLMFLDEPDKVKLALSSVNLVTDNIGVIVSVLVKYNVSEQDTSKVINGFLSLVKRSSTHHTLPYTWNNIQRLTNTLNIDKPIDYYLIDPEYLIDVPEINMYSAYFGTGRDQLPSSIRDIQFDIIFDSGCPTNSCSDGVNFINPTGLLQIRDTLTNSNMLGIYVKYNTEGIVSTGNMKYCPNPEDRKGVRLSEMTYDDLVKEFPVGLFFSTIKSVKSKEEFQVINKYTEG